MSDYSHILWDFNGTILDDARAAMECMNVLLRRRNKPPIKDIETYREVFCFPVTEYYKKVGFDFEKENIDTVINEWLEQYLISVKKAPLCEGVPETLELFKRQGKKQLILSASEKNIILNLLPVLGVDKYFDEVLGLDNFSADSKERIALLWMKRESPEKVLLIGDTAHDYRVARSIGADCVLIASGHESRKKLQAYGAPVFDTLKGYTAIFSL